MFGFGDGFGDVQQRLGGDASAEQADASQLGFQINQGNLHAEIGGQKGGGVTARPAPDDAKLCVHSFFQGGLSLRVPGPNHNLSKYA